MLKKISLLGIILCLGACDEKFDLKPPLKNILINNQYGIFVSITPYESNQYFLADYGKVYFLDTEKDSFETFSVDKNNFETKWVPTGVYYSPIHKKLYIANYGANNILETDINLEAKTLKIKQIIKSSQTISSENISMNKDHTLLASANYDGNVIEVFKKQNDDWKQQCFASVPLAHGITFHKDYIFATSLQNREVLKISPQDCKIIHKAGKQSWKVEDPGFLWPTQVTSWSKNKIAISDAHTGRITILEDATLKPKGYFGGMGPTWAHFNMPYGFIKNTLTNEFIVATAFPGRIHIGNSETGVIEKVYSPDKNWSFVQESSLLFKELTQNSLFKKLSQNPLSNNDWATNYQAPENYSKLKFLGQNFTLGYGRILNSNVHFIPPLPRGQDNIYFTKGNSNYFYFMDFLKLHKGDYFFSSQNRIGFFMAYKNTLYIIPWTLTFDCWKAGQELYNGNGPLDALTREKKSLDLVEGLEKQRLSNGLLPFESLKNTPFQTSETTKIEDLIKNSFISAPGQFFFEFIKGCQNAQCSLEQVQKASQKYSQDLLAIKNIYDVREIPFEEISAACLLAAPAHKALEQEIDKTIKNP
jgi:DNA-binding beta-propeller fold protein YncE